MRMTCNGLSCVEDKGQRWLDSLPASQRAELTELVEEKFWQHDAARRERYESLIRDWVADHGGDPDCRVLAVL